MEHVPEREHPGPGSGGGVSLRLFTALCVAGGAAGRLVEYGEQIADHSDGVTNVDGRSLHITWTFLGDVVEEHVPAVARALQVAAAGIPGPAACAVSGASAFGEGRVLGIDVDIDLLALLDSARDGFIEAILPYASGVDRRGWRPHVSVVRTSRAATLPDQLLVAPPEPPAARWIAPELVLYASLPGPVGRQYRILHVAPLGAAVRSR